MPAPYLNEEEAQSRLSDRYGLTDAPYPALLEIASDEVDSSGPWNGPRTLEDQEHAFPRSGSTLVPAAVLDFVVLRAVQLTREPEAAVSSKSVGDVSISYAGDGKRTKLDILVEVARRSLNQYRMKTGSVKGDQGSGKPGRTIRAV